jgi:hypothetical protein
MLALAQGGGGWGSLLEPNSYVLEPRAPSLRRNRGSRDG